MVAYGAAACRRSPHHTSFLSLPLDHIFKPSYVFSCPNKKEKELKAFPEPFFLSYTIQAGLIGIAVPLIRLSCSLYAQRPDLLRRVIARWHSYDKKKRPSWQAFQLQKFIIRRPLR